MLALYQVFRTDGHVVTQVVETEFVVGTESNIGHISPATSFRVRLMLIDTVYAQAMEHIKRAHPFRVTLSQVIVHGYHVHTVSSKCVQEHRQGSHQSLTFTGCHFRNLTLVQNDTTEQLYIIVYHAPLHVVATRYPMVFPDSLVTFNPYEVLSHGSQLTVHIRCRYLQFLVLCEAPAGILYNRKGSRQYIVQCLFILVQHLFFEFIDLSENRFTLFQIRRLDGRFQFLNFTVLFYCRLTDVFLQFFRFRTQFIVTQLCNFRIHFFYLVHPRLNFLHVA